MDLLVNDLSIHEQFYNIISFHKALSRLMNIRRVAQGFGREVHCHRKFLEVKPTPAMSIHQAVARLANDERRAVFSWLTRTGPFWDETRQHAEGEYLECKDEIVTDTAVGEAAFRMMNGMDCGLISISPSDWNYTPVDVTLRQNEELDDKKTTIKNWWCVDTFQDELQCIAPPIRSWDDLREASTTRFENLFFSENCFAPIVGTPFAKSAAYRFLRLLEILDRLARAFDANGVRTKEGHHIYQNYFTGDRALFSDSSDFEKKKFHQELTFFHPEDLRSSLFCTWHGKISHLTLRLHFSWPIEADKPVYIVYAGPKITKR